MTSGKLCAAFDINGALVHRDLKINTRYD